MDRSRRTLPEMVWWEFVCPVCGRRKREQVFPGFSPTPVPRCLTSTHKNRSMEPVPGWKW
jgi:hypothetical protein